MNHIVYLVERILFGSYVLLCFVLFFIKFVTANNQVSLMPRPFKILLMICIISLGMICIDPHDQIIFSPYTIRILNRFSTFSIMVMTIVQFNIYFFKNCCKIYTVPSSPEPQTAGSAGDKRRNSKLRTMIEKPENVEDSKIFFDLAIYTGWHFVACFVCVILSLVFLHTYLHVAGFSFMFLVNAIQLSYKWEPYRLAYVHRLQIAFDEYRLGRLLKNLGFWISIVAFWLFLIAAINNALVFDEDITISNCIDLNCSNLLPNNINIDFILFLLCLSILPILFRFFMSDPPVKPAILPLREESKNNNSPRPASDITSSCAETLSVADKAIVARFLTMAKDQQENVFIPLNTEPQEESTEGKTT